MNPASLILPDGRHLSYAEYGDLNGHPVMVFHGTPGSRLLIQILEPAALTLGVRLIAPERPGYGLTTAARRTLLDYPDDVIALADSLGLDRFAIVGPSGGASYALVCGYKIPQRITTIGLVSAMSPVHLRDFTREMAFMNRLILGKFARYAPDLAGFILKWLIRFSVRSSRQHLAEYTSPNSALTPEQFALIMNDQAEAFKNGGQGAAVDFRNLWQPWGFDLEAIPVPVWLWHSEQDTLAPVSGARYLAAQLPNCQATFFTEGEHGQILIDAPEVILRALLPKVVQTYSS